MLIKLLDEEAQFAILAAAGLVVQFGLQALINMAVNVQIAPSKGMTLPFISYGGSSMLALSIGMGLLLAFTRRNPYLNRSPYVVKWGGESFERMNIILAAGGTGGHMVPAHALAAELKARGHGVMLVTDDRGAKYPGLFKDVPVHILPAGRLGGGPLGMLKALRSVLRRAAPGARLVRAVSARRGGRLRRLSGVSGPARGERGQGADHPSRAECRARPGQPLAGGRSAGDRHQLCRGRAAEAAPSAPRPCWSAIRCARR